VQGRPRKGDWSQAYVARDADAYQIMVHAAEAKRVRYEPPLGVRHCTA
jgi:hypothetical protein